MSNIDREYLLEIKSALAELSSAIEQATSSLRTDPDGNVTIPGTLESSLVKARNIVTDGPIVSQGKQQVVGNDIPTYGNYKQGDIVWNDNPRPGSWVGWVCVQTGSPGVWKPFGAIAQ